MYFPQICADVFSCLPDRFISDICSNDYLMDSFFQIPETIIDSRYGFEVTFIVEWLVVFVR